MAPKAYLPRHRANDRTTKQEGSLKMGWDDKLENK